MYEPTPIEYLRHRFANLLRNGGGSVRLSHRGIDVWDAIDAIADLMLYRGIRWNNVEIDGEYLTFVLCR